MSKKEFITDELFAQILAVRDSGAVNMLDICGVQREAHNRDFFELVIFLDDRRKVYAEFILTGNRNEKGDEK